MNAARALRVARDRAGLTQSELAQRAGVPPPVVNRIERGKVVPRVDTLQRLLLAAGTTLEVAPRLTASVPRDGIRDLLRLHPRRRLPSDVLESLDELCRRRLKFVIVGDAAARLHGTPVEVRGMEIVPSGFLASLEVLIRRADPDRKSFLHAVQEETDLLNPGYRIYRDPDRHDLSLPLPRRRFRASRGRTGPELAQINNIDNSCEGPRPMEQERPDRA